MSIPIHKSKQFFRENCYKCNHRIFHLKIVKLYSKLDDHLSHYHLSDDQFDDQFDQFDDQRDRFFSKTARREAVSAQN